ncbi:MAG: hypothetical protein HY290_15990 [Planctomycetia bacterium]|nr:hypothetical protein [Planctomycetia bacterium]
MGLVIFSSVLSLGLIWAFRACARSAYWGMGGACLLAAGVTIVLVFLCRLFFLAVALQSALSFVLIFGCIVFRRKPKAVLPVSIAAMIASYGFFLITAFSKIQELSALRVRYPLESVADRLAYESNAVNRGVGVEAASHAATLSPEIEARLAMHEEQRARTNQPWRHNRRTMLAALHTRKSDDFAIAQGFGPTRMMPGFVSEREIELPQAETPPIPETADHPYDPEYESPDDLSEQGEPVRRQPPQEQLLAMHEAGFTDFLDPDRIGYVRDREHVAGFQSHRFTKVPQSLVPEGGPPASWKVARLELVSLLKHETPVAYVSKDLPQMDELRGAPTRPLNEFERQSLERLRSDEDVSIDETPERIRMVGSLRAAKNCLDCHSVPRGGLLGALTYELVPVRPNRKRGLAVSPPSS